MLGKGAFGRVYLVRRISTKDLYAMKVIPMKSAQYSLVKNEHDIFGKITGDYLVKAVFSFT
jgi:serine/threonine protein kinase